MSSVLHPSSAVRKSTQALNFFASHAGSGRPCAVINKLKALKLLFFADRYHLRKYGRPVTDCSYFAMKNGPVASEAKSVAEESAHLDPEALKYTRKFVSKSGDFDIASVAKVDSKVLSETDLEALDFAWRTFGQYDKYELRDITHHYPEWKRHESILDSDTKKRVRMNLEDFFDEPDPGYDPCHPLTQKERIAARELFREQEAFAKLWD